MRNVLLLLHIHGTFLEDLGLGGGVELAVQMQTSKSTLSPPSPTMPTNILNLRYLSIIHTNLRIANDGGTNVRW